MKRKFFGWLSTREQRVLEAQLNHLFDFHRQRAVARFRGLNRDAKLFGPEIDAHDARAMLRGALDSFEQRFADAIDVLFDADAIPEVPTGESYRRLDNRQLDAPEDA